MKTVLLQKATLFFLKNGYRKFSMNQVATVCSVSSTTLYKLFKNKETLIAEVLAVRKSLFFDLGSQIGEVTPNAIEHYFTLKAKIETLVPVEQQRKNLEQLNKYYSRLGKMALEDVAHITSTLFSTIHKRGVKEEIFDSHLNSEEAATLYSQLFLAYRYYSPIDANRLEEIVNTAEHNFIRGLLTAKGQLTYSGLININKLG